MASDRRVLSPDATSDDRHGILGDHRFRLRTYLRVVLSSVWLLGLTKSSKGAPFQLAFARLNAVKDVIFADDFPLDFCCINFIGLFLITLIEKTDGPRCIPKAIVVVFRADRMVMTLDR